MNFEIRIKLPMPSGQFEGVEDGGQQATAQSFSVELTTRDTVTYTALDFDRIYGLLNSVEDWLDLGPQFAGVGVHWVNLLNPAGKFNIHESKVKRRLAGWLQNLAEESSPLYQVALILMQPLIKHAVAYSDLMCKDQKEQLSQKERQRLYTLLEVFSMLEGPNKRPLFEQFESLAYDEIRTNRAEVEIRAMRIWTFVHTLSKCADLLNHVDREQALYAIRESDFVRNLGVNVFPWCAKSDLKIRRKYFHPITQGLILERNRESKKARRKQ